MHLKSYSIFFKNNSPNVLRKKNIFYLTSQNLSEAAWGTNTAQGQRNFELGVLFFDVPNL